MSTPILTAKMKQQRIGRILGMAGTVLIAAGVWLLIAALIAAAAAHTPFMPVMLGVYLLCGTIVLGGPVIGLGIYLSSSKGSPDQFSVPSTGGKVPSFLPPARSPSHCTLSNQRTVPQQFEDENAPLVGDDVDPPEPGASPELPEAKRPGFDSGQA